MRENPKLSLDSLDGGFSPAPREEQQCDKKQQSTQEALSKSAQENKNTQLSSISHKITPTTNSTHIKRIRRGGVKQKHMKPKPLGHIKLFSTNGAGIKNGKVASLIAEVHNTQANIITVQETHSRQKGKIFMGSEFVTFEAIRDKKGGGTMIAVHQDLNPKLVEEYNDEF